MDFGGDPNEINTVLARKCCWWLVGGKSTGHQASILRTSTISLYSQKLYMLRDYRKAARMYKINYGCAQNLFFQWHSLCCAVFACFDVPQLTHQDLV